MIRPARHRLQTADRLRAVRIRLVSIFISITLTGVTGMAIAGLKVDADQREHALVADLRITSSTVLSLIYREAGTLRLTGIADAIGARATGVYVFERRGDVLGPALARPGRTVGVPLRRLESAAQASISTNTDVVAKVTASDGTTQQVLAVAFAVENAGRPAGAVVVTVDAQESDAAHRRLAITLVGGGLGFVLVSGVGGYLLARRSTLIAGQALDQQERFLADAAHELRTPLTTIRLTAEGALRDQRHQPIALRHVIKSADRMTNAVESLLTRAQVVAGTRALARQYFRLDQLVSDVVAETVGSEHAVHAELAPTVFHGDPVVLRIGVRNLIENAVRHGGRDGQPAELIVVVDTGRISVRDYGPGLPGHGRHHSTAPGGHGLGLSIAEWAIGLHGGLLTFSSPDGGGTLAEVGLP